MTYSEIKSLVYLYTKTNSTSLPDATMVILANRALERVVSLINRADSRWEFDDTNQTDLPIATTTLTSGQQDYSLATSHLSINRVEIKDTGGNWHLLRPIDRNTVTREALAEYLGSGTPLEYDKIGNSVFLYPIPNYTQAASLKLYFTRGPVAFDSDDTTDEPGFNSLFHKLVPLWASYDYALANGLKNANQIFAEIIRMEDEIQKFYGMRSRDERGRMIVGTNPPTGGSFGNQSGRIGHGGGDSNI